MSKSQKALDSLRKDPLIQKLVKTRPVFWSNPKKTDVFAGKMMEPLLSGCYTAEDNMLYELLYMLADSENKYLEPSALAGMFGPVQLFTTEEGKRYLQDNQLQSKMKNAVHIIWGTVGSMVPRGEMETYHRIGSALINSKK